MPTLPKLPNWSAQEYERAFVITSFIGMFAFELIHETIWGNDPQIKNMLIGALIGSVATACVQYLFGTTPQSAAKDATIGQMAINTQEALHATPPPETIPGPASPRGPAGPQGPQGSHVAAFLLAALVSLAIVGQGQPASAADLRRGPPPKGVTCGWPPLPDCRVPTPNPISGITQFTVDDLTKAINIASKPPVLTAEVACFGLVRDGLAALQENADTTGDGLATIYVKLVRVNALKKAIISSDDCLAVCGRAESLVPVGILTHIPINIVPTMCSVIKAATP